MNRLSSDAMPPARLTGSWRRRYRDGSTERAHFTARHEHGLWSITHDPSISMSGVEGEKLVLLGDTAGEVIFHHDPDGDLRAAGQGWSIAPEGALLHPRMEDAELLDGPHPDQFGHQQRPATSATLQHPGKAPFQIIADQELPLLLSLDADPVFDASLSDITPLSSADRADLERHRRRLSALREQRLEALRGPIDDPATARHIAQLAATAFGPGTSPTETLTYTANGDYTILLHIGDHPVLLTSGTGEHAYRPAYGRLETTGSATRWHITDDHGLIPAATLRDGLHILNP